MREAVKRGRDLDEFRLDRRIMRREVRALRFVPAERCVIVMPARLHRDEVGLAFAESAGAAGPAAQFDIAGVVEFGFIIADQGFEIAGFELCQSELVPAQLRIAVAVGAGEMRHAAARNHGRAQAHCRDRTCDRLTESIAALHAGLRRQIGIDVDRQDRRGDAEMGQRNADRVIDLRGRGERRVEALAIKFLHQLEADLARHFPAEFVAGEIAGGLAADMDREGRRRIVEELLGVIVREDDPQIGIESVQLLADIGGGLLDAHNRVFVFRVGKREELGCVREHRSADDRRFHEALLQMVKPNLSVG